MQRQHRMELVGVGAVADAVVAVGAVRTPDVSGAGRTGVGHTLAAVARTAADAAAAVDVAVVHHSGQEH